MTEYRLLVLACSASKKEGPEWLEAINRYNGPLWQTLRSCELPSNLAVMALSARYGLFRSSVAIERYDHRVTPELSAAAVSGEVVNPFNPLYCRQWKATINELRDAREMLRCRHGAR